jgi:hypothetical protein
VVFNFFRINFRGIFNDTLNDMASNCTTVNK